MRAARYALIVFGATMSAGILTDEILAALCGMNWKTVYARAKEVTTKDPWTLSATERRQNPALLLTYLRGRDLCSDFCDADAIGASMAAREALADGDAMKAMWALDHWCESHELPHS